MSRVTSEFVAAVVSCFCKIVYGYHHFAARKYSPLVDQCLVLAESRFHYVLRMLTFVNFGKTLPVVVVCRVRTEYTWFFYSPLPAHALCRGSMLCSCVLGYPKGFPSTNAIETI